MSFTENGGCRIWYEAEGSGPPVVMIYGIGGHSRNWWTEFPRRLRERYTIVMLDNRGTGFSDRPTEPWTMFDMTGDVQAVVDAMGLESYHLLGCSLGSIIARHYARERRGDQLRSLALLCPPNGEPASEADRNAALFWDRTKPAIDNARGGWPIIHPQEWIDANEERLVEAFEENLKDPTPERTFMFQLRAAEEAGRQPETLNDSAWPVLIAHGVSDRLVPVANAHTLKAEVPQARLEVLEGASHNMWQHAPDRLSDVVLSFLDAAEAQREGA